MIKIENNFLNNQNLFEINQIITSINFPWYISDSINKFIHPLIKDTGGKKESSLFMSKILNPVLENINVNTIISADVILQMPSINKIKVEEKSNSLDLNTSTTGILCLNTFNGFIETLNSKEQSIIQNKFFSFPTNIGYFSYSHTDNCFGLILRLVYSY
jgi:hypothetical protein